MPQCPRCGNQINDVAIWCPVCGYPLKPDEIEASRSAAEKNQPKVAQEYYDRPEGIELLAGLTFVSGAFIILFIIGTFALFLNARGETSSPTLSILLPVMLLLVVASMVEAWALWNGKGWAWTLTVVGSSIGAIVSAYETVQSFWNTYDLAIYLLLLYYLFRPSVRGYFGKLRAPPKDNYGEAARGA
jgi:uncharacterized membrane protein (DUF2068 family)